MIYAHYMEKEHAPFILIELSLLLLIVEAPEHRQYFCFSEVRKYLWTDLHIFCSSLLVDVFWTVLYMTIFFYQDADCICYYIEKVDINH